LRREMDQMTCEEVRELLPAYVDRDLHAVGPVEVHLGTCESCRAELARYRDLLASLASMRDTGEEPGPEFLDRMLELIPPVFADQGRKLRYALASIGGAAVGATALAILWWRIAHRGVQRPESESPSIA